MSEGLRKAPILMEGFGRVNLLHVLGRSEVTTDTGCSSGSSPIRQPVLAPSRSFLLLISVDCWIELVSHARDQAIG